MLGSLQVGSVTQQPVGNITKNGKCLTSNLDFLKGQKSFYEGGSFYEHGSVKWRKGF